MCETKLVYNSPAVRSDTGITYNPLLIFRKDETIAIFNKPVAGTDCKHIYYINLVPLPVFSFTPVIDGVTNYCLVAGQIINDKFGYVNVGDYEKHFLGSVLEYLHKENKYTPGDWFCLHIFNKG